MSKYDARKLAWYLRLKTRRVEIAFFISISERNWNMRLLGVLFLLLIVVIGVGYYLDWFQVKKGDANGKTNIEVTIDKQKIQADENRAKSKIQDLGHQAGERTKEATGSSHPDKS